MKKIKCLDVDALYELLDDVIDSKTALIFFDGKRLNKRKLLAFSVRCDFDDIFDNGLTVVCYVSKECMFMVTENTRV